MAVSVTRVTATRVTFVRMSALTSPLTLSPASDQRTYITPGASLAAARQALVLVQHCRACSGEARHAN